MDNKDASPITAGFPTLLLLTFIILKLCGVIDWSWWWVLSPFWIMLCLSLLLFIAYLLLRR